jgi:hypothetical protein
MMTLAAIPLTFVAVLCFVAGTRYPYERWRRLTIAAIGVFALGSFMMVATGYFWGHKDARAYYEEILRQIANPRPPHFRPPVRSEPPKEIQRT